MSPEYASRLQQLRTRAKGGQGALFRYSTPARFFPLAGALARVFGLAAVAFGAVGLFVVFFVVPGDTALGTVSRIAFLHLPAAWMSIWIYLVIAGWSAVGLLLDTRLSVMMASALAPTGAAFTLLELWTGLLWNKPVWGDWLVWDERLFCGIVLLAHYLALIGLQWLFRDVRRGDRASAAFALCGLATIPLICSALPRSARTQLAAIEHLLGVSSTSATLIAASVTVTLGFWAYSIAASMYRVRAIMLERERRARWVRQALGGVAVDSAAREAGVDR